MIRATRIYDFDENDFDFLAFDAKGKMNHRGGDLVSRFYLAKDKIDLIQDW